MTLGFLVGMHDDDSYMLGPDTYKPEPSVFYDWRFGKDGVPHPATCGTCGRKTDPDYVSPVFRVKRRNRDITCTYDGYTLVSRRFKDVCEGASCAGAVFVPLPADEAFFWLRSDRTIAFDAVARGTRFEKPCPACGTFYSVVGATPVRLRNAIPLGEGFYRTDLEFGSGHEQHPLLIVGVRTAEMLKAATLKGLELRKIDGGE